MDVEVLVEVDVEVVVDVVGTKYIVVLELVVVVVEAGGMFLVAVPEREQSVMLAVPCMVQLIVVVEVVVEGLGMVSYAKSSTSQLSFNPE